MLIREILVEPQQIAWLPWAVSYFYFIGLAIASVLLAIFVSPNKNLKFEFIAITMALSFSLVAPIALLGDLHQPSRIWNFYLHLAPWSVMAWGAMLLPLFLCCILGYFCCLLMQIRPVQFAPHILKGLYRSRWNNVFWIKTFRILTAVLALAIFLYTSMEIFVVEARVLWHQYWIMPLILFSALSSAAVLYQFLLALLVKNQSFRYLSHLISFCLVLFLGAILGMYFSQNDVEVHLNQLWQQSSLPLLTLVIVGMMLLFNYVTKSLWAKGILVLLAFVFCWAVRWILLIQVQTIAKYNALANPYELSWSEDSLVGILAVFSLWLFIVILLERVVAKVNFMGDQHE